MKNRRISGRQRIIYAGIAVMILMFAATPLFAQQTNFKVGDRVEADVNMSSSPENAKWEKATIVEIMMWQGKISGIYVKTDSGANYTLRAEHLRPIRGGSGDNAGGGNPTKPDTKNNSPQNGDGETPAVFKVGDRVEVDSIMANDPKDSTWVKATVKAVDLKNGRYVVMRDDFNEMSVLIRPGKIWIRHLNDGSAAPEYATCEFYKNYPKVSNTAPASGELFKAIIFQGFYSTTKYRDFGLVFEEFRLGKPFKNRALGNGRKDVDPAPVGATIYPLKTKLVFCEKDVENTWRTEWTNEYSCFKDKFSEWTCKGGAFQNHKRTSFPNK